MRPLNWKKNVFSCAAWLFCLLLTGYGLWLLAGLWLPEAGIAGSAAQYVTSGGVLLLAGLLNVFVWLARKKGLGVSDGFFERRRWLGRLLETALCLAVLGAGVYLRWRRLPLADGAGYFETAMMKAGQGVPLLPHGAEALYVLALHGVCFVLGNSLLFCAWFQLCLQALAGIACYLGIRRLTGSLSALLFGTCYFLSPGVIEKASSLGPEPLFLMMFGVGLTAAGGFLKKASGLPLGYLITGAAVGIAVYLDISGLALLGILATVFYVEREDPDRFWNGRAVSFLTALAGLGAAMAGCFAVDACYSGISFKSSAQVWTGLYLTAGRPGEDPVRLLLEMDRGRETAGVLFLLLAAGVFSFFLKKRQERTGVWVLAGGILCLLEGLGMTLPGMNGAELFLLCLSALAGTALSNYGREAVLEKAGIRRWDPSLYGIVEDNVEKQITEAELEGRYSEGEQEDGTVGYENAAGPETVYTEGEYRDGGDPGEAAESAAGTGTAAQGDRSDREDPEAEVPGQEGEPGPENGNFVTRIFSEKKRKKEQQRQEMEKVLSVLSAISEDTEVSISPDHKPGEELVKTPAKEGKKNAPGEAADDGRKPLHNPLPVPKKKQATMLDYDYEVSDEDDYDYD